MCCVAIFVPPRGGHIDARQNIIDSIHSYCAFSAIRDRRLVYGCLVIVCSLGLNDCKVFSLDRERPRDAIHVKDVRETTNVRRQPVRPAASFLFSYRICSYQQKGSRCDDDTAESMTNVRRRRDVSSAESCGFVTYLLTYPIAAAYVAWAYFPEHILRSA